MATASIQREFKTGLVGEDGGGRAQLYSLPAGFIYAASAAFSGATRRPPWVVLLSLSSAPITLRAEGRVAVGRALVVGPQVARSFELGAEGIASINVEPNHPDYPALTDLGDPAFRVLPHEAFDAWLPVLRDCRQGWAARSEVAEAFDGVVATTLRHLSSDSVRRDARIVALVEKLARESPLDYEFAAARRLARLSSGRLSHKFTQDLGLSIRSFLHWRKIKEGLRLLATEGRLTEVAHAAGFCDSAHFSRSFQASLGLLPSLMANGRYIQVHDLHST